MRVRATIRGNQAVRLNIAAAQIGRGIIAPAQAGNLIVPATQNGRAVIAPFQEARLTIQPHVLLILQPEILTGPDVTPGLTTATVEWTTDFEAYYRIRWKAAPGDSWIEEDWSGDQSAAPSVGMTDLDPEHESYYIEVQSAGNPAVPATFTEWTPTDPAYFFTLCSGVYGMDNWNAVKSGGKLPSLTLSWTTTVKMYLAQIDSTTPYLDGTYWNSSSTSHSKMFRDFDFTKSGTYYWRTRNYNYCYQWCSYSGWRAFTVGGPPEYDITWVGEGGPV